MVHSGWKLAKIYHMNLHFRIKKKLDIKVHFWKNRCPKLEGYVKEPLEIRHFCPLCTVWYVFVCKTLSSSRLWFVKKHNKVCSFSSESLTSFISVRFRTNSETYQLGKSRQLEVVQCTKSCCMPCFSMEKGVNHVPNWYSRHYYCKPSIITGFFCSLNMAKWSNHEGNSFIQYFHKKDFSLYSVWKSNQKVSFYIQLC